MAFDFDNINSEAVVDLHLLKLAVDDLNKCVDDYNHDIPELNFPYIETYTGGDGIEYIRYNRTVQDFKEHWEDWMTYLLKRPDNVLCLVREGLFPTEVAGNLVHGNYTLKCQLANGKESISKESERTFHTLVNPFFRIESDHKLFEYSEVLLDYQMIYNIIILYSICYTHLGCTAKDFSTHFFIDNMLHNWYTIKNPIEDTINFLEMVASDHYDVKMVMTRCSADSFCKNIMLNLMIHKKITAEQFQAIIEQTEYSYRISKQQSLYNTATLILAAIKENENND